MQKVLIVEDEEINREILRDMLAADYAVDVAEDGEQAIQKLWECPSEIEAILLDLNMPKLDGFAVLREMSRNRWISRMPVLIISGEDDAEVENQCFDMGVLDFIHKPFEASVVRRRIRNAVELYRYKNRLEQQVEQQTEVLREKDHIIQMQADRLKREESFHNLMLLYRCAIMEVETKLKVLNEDFSKEYNRNPIETIKSRLKSPESIYEKMEKKGYPVTVENIEEYLSDVAGIRVICSFPDDIYRLAELLTAQDDITLLKRKDYIKEPKANGYRSLHLIVSIPIFLSKEKKYMKAEVQLRTIAMDFWASLEHKLKYKKDVESTEEIVEQLKVCADSIEALDYQMQNIRNKIDSSRE